MRYVHGFLLYGPDKLNHLQPPMANTAAFTPHMISFQLPRACLPSMAHAGVFFGGLLLLPGWIVLASSRVFVVA